MAEMQEQMHSKTMEVNGDGSVCCYLYSDRPIKPAVILMWLSIHELWLYLVKTYSL